MTPTTRREKVIQRLLQDDFTFRTINMDRRRNTIVLILSKTIEKKVVQYFYHKDEDRIFRIVYFGGCSKNGTDKYSDEIPQGGERWHAIKSAMEVRMMLESMEAS